MHVKPASNKTSLVATPSNFKSHENESRSYPRSICSGFGDPVSRCSFWATICPIGKYVAAWPFSLYSELCRFLHFVRTLVVLSPRNFVSAAAVQVVICARRLYYLLCAVCKRLTKMINNGSVWINRHSVLGYILGWFLRINSPAYKDNFPWFFEHFGWVI